MPDFFCYDSLLRFFAHLKTTAPLVQFHDADGTHGILLRHDIDFDILPAYRLACLEYDANVESTFFVMMTNQFYNPLSVRNSLMLREMVRMGFEIGLHFDPAICSYESHDALTDRLEREVLALEFALELERYEVQSVSLHQPGNGGVFPVFKGFRNAYDPTFFSHDTYLSDSCRTFRGKEPYEFVKQASGRMVQVVLHPVYYSEYGQDYKGLLDHYIADIRQSSREFFHDCSKISDEEWK